ncbi:hypothetical protein ACXR8F_10165 [Terrabacter sp. AAH1]
MQSNVWCDIGNNFLVDRFGRIYEGRKGGLTGFTQGAHAGGFNAETFGVSVIGTSTSVTMPSAVTSGAHLPVRRGPVRLRAGDGTTPARHAHGARHQPASAPGQHLAGAHRAGAALERDGRHPQRHGAERDDADERHGIPGPHGPPLHVQRRRGAGRNVSTQVTVGVAPGGKVRLFNAKGSINVIADLEGYFRTGTGAGYAAYTRHARGHLPRHHAQRDGHDDADRLPDRTARPAVPTLSVSAGTPVANLITIPADQSGRVTLWVAQGQADVVVDALGFYADGRGLKFVAVAPRRLVDTRLGWGVAGGALEAGRATTFGIPDTTYPVWGASLSAGGASTANGWLSLYRSGQSQPGTSSLSTLAGRSVTNAVTTSTTTGSLVNVYNAAGSTHVVADLMGYYTP